MKQNLSLTAQRTKITQIQRERIDIQIIQVEMIASIQIMIQTPTIIPIIRITRQVIQTEQRFMMETKPFLQTVEHFTLYFMATTMILYCLTRKKISKITKSIMILLSISL